ncbi:MAG: peptide chain release factor N(5)-glutamine methyltransferase [Lachnospiraceae bacterium]|jgi:release factor glutamine methyltransferase|nr:peptide chain release factor N(5)-glutamine methyltransferase [Lachnospiraceae bacterium]
MKYQELLNLGAARLSQAGISEAELDARLLLEAVCGTSKHDLLAHGEREVAAGHEERYVNHIARREKREPLQYILGEQEFMGLAFKVTPEVLIPRQDSETLVEEVLRHLHDGQTILDMCTGSGCLLLSLLHYSNYCQGTGVDISAPALAIAAENERRLRALPRETEPIGRVTWIESDLFTKVVGQYDIIVTNPPYIPTAELAGLMPEIRDHEPALALDGHADGLYYYRRIVDQASQHINRYGRIFLETAPEQAATVAGMLAGGGYKDIEIIKDLSGHDRVVTGKRI